MNYTIEVTSPVLESADFSGRTVEETFALLRAAIDRVHQARRHFAAVNRNPASSRVERFGAGQGVLRAENEFGWQWRNVEWLLEKLESSNFPAFRHASELDERAG